MAVLTMPGNVQKVWYHGFADRIVMYALKNVSTGDTIDLLPDCSVIERGVVLGTTVSVAIATSQTGATVTMPAGLTSDAGWLLVWGSGTTS